MTIVVTLPETSVVPEPVPPSPSFLRPSSDPEQDLHYAIHAILNAKGLVVVMGECCALGL